MPEITMKSCKSSNVAEHGYDEATKTLAIRFKAGSLYHYQDVPKEKYDALCCCESVGRFVAGLIKEGFVGERMNPPAR